MTNIKMPALSPTMTSGTLTKWLVKEGDNVKSGDIIAEIETDKATMELESIDDGIVNKILFKEGEQNIEVGTVIAKIGDDDQNDDKTMSILPSTNKDENLILTKTFFLSAGLHQTTLWKRSGGFAWAWLLVLLQTTWIWIDTWSIESLRGFVACWLWDCV